MLTGWYILRGSAKQYFFQLVTSLCHLFSCSLYFIMDLPQATHCDPNPIYFYIYFIAFNMPWIMVYVYIKKVEYFDLTYLNRYLLCWYTKAISI